MLGVWLATLVKDSRHAWSLVYYNSEGLCVYVLCSVQGEE